MLTKFVLWLTGLVMVVALAVTGYGVITGTLPWKDYLAVWTGVGGTLLGYVGRMISAP